MIFSDLQMFFKIKVVLVRTFKDIQLDNFNLYRFNSRIKSWTS